MCNAASAQERSAAERSGHPTARGVAGYVGMWVAVRSNVRVASAACRSFQEEPSGAEQRAEQRYAEGGLGA